MWRRELSRSLFLLLLTCRDQLADLIGAKLRDRLTPLIDSLTGDSERVRKLSDRVVEMGKDVAGFHRDPILSLLRVARQASLGSLLVVSNP